MASIAHFQAVLKKDMFKHIMFMKGFLSGEDVLSFAMSQDYHWRNRVWNPVLTFWTFISQV